MANLLRHARRIGRLASLALGTVAAIVAVMLGPPWIEAIAGLWGLRIPVVSLLVGLEAVYVSAVVAASVGVVALGLAVYRARRRRGARLGMARWLLACGFGLSACVLAEGTAAAWHSWEHRAPALTAPKPTAREPVLSGRFDRPAVGDRGEVTLTVIGGSSAMGVPFEWWLSVGAIVAWQLERAIPGQRFRLDLLARAAETLADQHRALARDGRRPDVLIVYAGHNEFHCRIPWSRRVAHYRDDRHLPVLTLEESVARFSPICALIHETADRHRNAARPWVAEAPPLVDAPAYTPSEFGVRLADFAQRLETIVAFGDRIRALTILVIPPGNDAGLDPNRSFLSPETTRADREAFTRDFQAVRRSESSDPSRAVAGYRELIARQPGFAESHYRLGRLLDDAGDRDAAYREFVAARDLDGLPMRCPSRFQQVYRDVAARHPDAILIDGQAIFHAIGHHGLLDDHLFHDSMHPTLRGHIALAQAILDAMASRRPPGWLAGFAAPRIDPTECAAHFGIGPTEWQILADHGAGFWLAAAPMRYDGSHRMAMRAAFQDAADRLAAGDSIESIGMPSLGVPTAAEVTAHRDP